MIPQTYPSILQSDGEHSMAVKFLTSVTGLQPWKDYIPVKLVENGTRNSYNNDGFISVQIATDVSSTAIPFEDYVPVYVDNTATKAWSTDIGGYIPYSVHYGATATMILDFTNSSLDSRITFTRASTATFVGSNGLIQSAAIDTPRFDYDPATLAARGLLIEESRANSFTYSEDLTDASWTKSSTTITANDTTSPDGTVNADKITANATTATFFVAKTFVAANSTIYTISCFAKAGEESVLFFRGGAATEEFGTGNPSFASFNLSTGVATVLGFATSASMEPFGNGWYRCSAVTVATAATGSGTMTCQFLLRQNSSWTADGTTGLYMWGAQLEAGAFPTSYIPTTTTSLTRSADSATVSTLSPWFNATEGTLFSQANTFSGATANLSFYLSDGTTSNRIQIGHGNGAARAFISSGGVTQVSQNPGTYVPNATSKVALGYATNNSNSAMNGSLSTLDTNCTIPSGINAMRIGGITLINSVLNGWVSRITYYPRRLSDAELQTITT